MEITFLERDNNDTRKDKIVHPIDGRVIPLDINRLEKEGNKLALKVNRLNFDYVVGFAEGGILPSFGLAYSLKKPLVCSYRVKLKFENEIHFTEPHSMRANHYIYGLKKGDKVLIVEDEITTGNTLLNAIIQLKKAGIIVVGICSYILNHQEQNIKEIFAESNVNLYYLYEVKNGCLL